MNSKLWPCALIVLVAANKAQSAEIIRIDASRYATVLPKGKEVDAIIGDYVIRNDQIIAVVADTLPDRKANMTTQRVGGCVIDLTRRRRQSDQLTAYYPGDLQFLYTKAAIEQATGEEVVLRCWTEVSSSGIVHSVTYRLRDGEGWLRVERKVHNQSSNPVSVPLADSVRADTSFEAAPNGEKDFFWVADNWFKQAYGLLAEGRRMRTQSSRRSSKIEYFADGSRVAQIPPAETFTLRTTIIPADNLVALRATADKIAGVRTHILSARVRDTAGQPVGHAALTVQRGNEIRGSARTEADGTVELPLPEGTFQIEADALARGSREVEVKVRGAMKLEIQLPTAPTVSATVTDAHGGPIPCKVQFLGTDGTEDPNFGPNTQGPGVSNIYYSHDGRFDWPVPAGKYRVLISYGPEYDLVTREIEMKPGRTTTLTASLDRVVKTPGWVSAEIHSHSTPSGDNTTSMHGRVLNLLAEHLEFAPCTEHNRLDSYVPVLKRLGCERWMATCTGMELTGQPLPLNHQNAFPLVLRPGMQDNGAPPTDIDPEVQIRRLAGWDDNSEKLVQTNHPDLGWMYFDRDGNGARDAGFYRMFAFQDVVEIWGNSPQSMADESILAMRPVDARGRNDRLFAWLQLLNQGYRMIAVGNTDAHYTDHGSGWIRNYVRSSTDDVTKIDTMEMVREFEAGHVVVTNGPYLEVALESGTTALPGDVAQFAQRQGKLRIRVQCPNWFDVNRVQVLLNGSADPRYNFTRAKQPGMFSNEVVKFDRQIELKWEDDVHVIVAAVGEGLGFGNVYGPKFKNVPPTAFSNPIFVDADGNGFTSNGDTLGYELPVKADLRKEVLQLIRKRAKQKKKAN